jgi:hypothetical protein
MSNQNGSQVIRTRRDWWHVLAGSRDGIPGIIAGVSFAWAAEARTCPSPHGQRETSGRFLRRFAALAVSR